MSTAVARNLMAEMKLLGMFDSFDRLLTEAIRDQWSCGAFFDAMLQAENDYRTERMRNSRDAGQRFHGMPGRDFTPCRARISRHAGPRFHVMPGRPPVEGSTGF